MYDERAKAPGGRHIPMVEDAAYAYLILDFLDDVLHPRPSGVVAPIRSERARRLAQVRAEAGLDSEPAVRSDTDTSAEA